MMTKPDADTPTLDRVRALLSAEDRHIAVFDTEYTAWEGSLARGWSGPNEYREIVQIGAVKLRLAPGLPEVSAFDALTRPVFNPMLSDYFTGLTGITNAAVAEHGVDYAVGLTRFAEFTADCAMILSNGGDEAHLTENADWRQAAWPFMEDAFTDVRPDFAATLGLPRSETISCELPRLFGLPFEGRAHDGLADARAIAVALRHAVGPGRLDERRWRERRRGIAADGVVEDHTWEPI